jgi:hypothetical protein
MIRHILLAAIGSLVAVASSGPVSAKGRVAATR